MPSSRFESFQSLALLMRSYHSRMVSRLALLTPRPLDLNQYTQTSASHALS